MVIRDDNRQAEIPNCQIKGCTCRHEYQDERYGKGKRVHNAGKAPNGSIAWICTVCGRRK